jgi:hypothetical protein
MPGRGLEPLRISPPDPKSGASANFATLANRFSTLDFRFAIARSTPSGLRERENFIVSLFARAAEFTISETSKISYEGD